MLLGPQGGVTAGPWPGGDAPDACGWLTLGKRAGSATNVMLASLAVWAPLVREQPLHATVTATNARGGGLSPEASHSEPQWLGG